MTDICSLVLLLLPTSCYRAFLVGSSVYTLSFLSYFLVCVLFFSTMRHLGAALYILVNALYTSLPTSPLQFWSASGFSPQPVPCHHNSATCLPPHTHLQDRHSSAFNTFYLCKTSLLYLPPSLFHYYSSTTTVPHPYLCKRIPDCICIVALYALAPLHYHSHAGLYIAFHFALQPHFVPRFLSPHPVRYLYLSPYYRRIIVLALLCRWYCALCAAFCFLCAIFTAATARSVRLLLRLLPFLLQRQRTLHFTHCIFTFYRMTFTFQ